MLINKVNNQNVDLDILTQVYKNSFIKSKCLKNELFSEGDTNLGIFCDQKPRLTFATTSDNQKTRLKAYEALKRKKQTF